MASRRTRSVSASACICAFIVSIGIRLLLLDIAFYGLCAHITGHPDIVGRVPKVSTPQPSLEMRKHYEQTPSAGPLQNLGDDGWADHRRRQRGRYGHAPALPLDRARHTHARPLFASADLSAPHRPAEPVWVCVTW
jgi:hypothetical protein